MPRSSLLLVGWNSGIRKALRSASVGEGDDRARVAVLVPARSSVPDVAEVDAAAALDPGSTEDDVLAQAAALLEDAAPRAVVVLAERTVTTAARLRAAYGLPGNDETVALRCADKIEMKRAVNAAGIPAAPWRAIEEHTNAADLVEALGLPLVVKPSRDSGGRGQRRCDAETDVRDALAVIRSASGMPSGADEPRRWLAEGWVDGVEMSVETFVRGGEPCFHNPTQYLVPRHANAKYRGGLISSASRYPMPTRETAMPPFSLVHGPNSKN